MARAFAKHPDVEIDWLFSGRAPGDYFDMGSFGPWIWQRGLSFATRNGRIAHMATARQLRPLQFLRDIDQLAIHDYDIVITDFEPITAWAARSRGVPCIGIGHQYAFTPGLPHRTGNLAGRLVLKHYAPVTTEIGLHWDSFGQQVLPPIIDLESHAAPTANGRVLVYLPFEDQRNVLRLLQALPQWRFELFGPRLTRAELGNVNTHPTGRSSFFQALLRASHVICNCGFELISEALLLGKQILAKPLHGQMEQESNALALQALDYAQITGRLETRVLKAFLARDAAPVRIHYPDVAEALGNWVVRRDQSLEALCRRLWSATTVRREQAAGGNDAVPRSGPVATLRAIDR
jgi:uncharacterized protein (TIGR00661 family)